MTVTAPDDQFAPACIQGAAEDVLTLVVRNACRHPHNLTLDTGDSVSVDSARQRSSLPPSARAGGGTSSRSIREWKGTSLSDGDVVDAALYGAGADGIN